VVTSHKMSVAANDIQVRAAIGKPISNTSIYILDEYFNPVPMGAIGEIYIGGANLASGYLNLEKLSKERFITHPFVHDQQVYKTGDQAYWNTDGTIVYVGRADDQVKIRGFRIELGEVETVLQQSKDIDQCVVLAQGDSTLTKYLTAYIVPKDSYDVTIVEQYLSENLPAYMIPSFIVEIEVVPMTSNGKVDKNALLNIAIDKVKVAEHIAPENLIEEELVRIWKEVLKLESLGVTDNFFKLGGHSLNAIIALHKTNEHFDCNLSIKYFYETQTIRKLSELIKLFGKNVIAEDEIMEDLESLTI